MLRALVVMTAVAGIGCGSPITSTRIENSIAPTFANLVHLQVSWLGLPAMGPSDFGVKANCRRLLDGATAGSGEWICTVVWKAPTAGRFATITNFG